ncbi:hypothetical protein [Pseudoduganella violaceinigra]|uniref:hypothetical protein n=1 Tax=Pseudoduganella violaceinigra TaxID=246602 RepID=UPI000484350A|nr:hypothetical protein [Pseudoduganella violaceinigra]
MAVDSDTWVLSGGTFLLGVVVTATINSFMRRQEKRDNDLVRHQSLAYAHVVRMTEFMAAEAIFRESLAAFPALDIPAGATFKAMHRNAIEFEEFLRSATQDAKKTVIADIKHATGLIRAYLADFHLTAEKLADLPRSVIFAYNQFQLDARRIAGELQHCCDRLENDNVPISAEVICRAVTAYNAHAESARKLHDELTPLTNLSADEIKDLYSDCYVRMNRMVAEIKEHMSAIQSARKSIADLDVTQTTNSRSDNCQSYSAANYYRSNVGEHLSRKALR